MIRQDPDASSPKFRKDPDTDLDDLDPDAEILHKWSYRILILCEDPFGPLVSGSCKTTCAKSLYLAQVVRQDPEKDPGSRYKWSKRILIQRSCTSDPTGS